MVFWIKHEKVSLETIVQRSGGKIEFEVVMIEIQHQLKIIMIQADF
jgi:hypothetical protein